MKRPFTLLILTGLLFIAAPHPVKAGVCTGNFVNPITDICWDCIFPISIGPITVFDERLIRPTRTPFSAPARQPFRPSCASASLSGFGNRQGWWT